jgi:hypothetical protein
MNIILFEKDWLRYPQAIIDYQTTNRSALELAAKLSMMGVKNNAFFLVLLDKELQGVDPHSSVLTTDQMYRIGVECKRNPWYFFREVARAPARSGVSGKKVQFNRANICLWWCFFNHITIILIQPRQTGKSFSTDLLMTELTNFLCFNTQINLMTKDDKLRVENIKRLKDIYDELPGYLNFKTKADVSNTEEISIGKFNNTYKTHVPQGSEKKAYNQGRGMTSAIFHIDEPPFQAHIGISMPSALMAMAAAVEDAKEANDPYGVIMTTTAGKIDDRDGAFIYKIVNQSAVWSELFYDCKNSEELEVVVRQHSRSDEEGRTAFRVYASFNHKQLGKDDAWLMEQIERTTVEGEDADRDLFNIWTSGSLSSPLSKEAAAAVKTSIIPVAHDQIFSIGSYILRWYIPQNAIANFMANRKVTIGIDTSDASGGDDIGVVFTDVETGATIAAGNYNVTSLVTFVTWLIYLLETFENTVMVIERRSSAIMIIDFLLDMLPTKGIDPFKRLFNWVVNDPLEYPEFHEESRLPMSRRSSNIYVRAKRHFGFATSGTGQTSRSELYSTTLQQAARQCGNRIYDNALATQLLSLIKKDGRVDHPTGGHDDLVIGWLLNQWFLTKAKNLSAYGIDNRKVLSNVEVKRNQTKEEMVEDHYQKVIRDRIDTLYSLISAEYDDIMLERYERQLRSLEKELVLKEGEVFTLDAFLDEIKSSRQRRRGAPVAELDTNAMNHNRLQRLGARLPGETQFF